MKNKNKIHSAFLILTLLALGLGSTVKADEESSNLALRELSSIVGREIKDKSDAKKVCDEEKYVVACADIGKKFSLYKAEQVKEVDAVLGEIKGTVALELKECSDDDCLVGVANRLAERLVSKNPGLANRLDLTSKKIEEKRVVINVAKEVGVSVRECRDLDPDQASVEMLRACAKLAKNSAVRSYIPEGQIKMADKSLELKTALDAGKYSCGDNTVDGCGRFCMSPTAADRGKEPPAVCKQIASEVFGEEGVRELEKAYSQVGQATEFYNKRFENLRFETEDGKALYDPMAIGDYLKREGERGNVKVVERGLDFMIANGFAKSEDKDFVLKMVRKVSEGGGRIPSFDDCAKDPKSCEAFIPEDRKAEFEAASGVRDVMAIELEKEGIKSPFECQNPENGEKCVAASKRALPQLEALAEKSPEARRIATDIRQKIEFGEEGRKVREEAMKKFQSEGKINIAGNEFSNFGDVQKFCQENGEVCLTTGVEQGFVPKDFAAQKFEQSVNVQSNYHPEFPPGGQGRPFEGFRPEMFPGQNPQGGFPGQAPQFQGGFEPGFNKEEALAQFQKFLDDPSKNPLPSILQRGPMPLPPRDFDMSRGDQGPVPGGDQFRQNLPDQVRVYPPAQPQSQEGSRQFMPSDDVKNFPGNDIYHPDFESRGDVDGRSVSEDKFNRPQREIVGGQDGQYEDRGNFYRQSPGGARPMIEPPQSYSFPGGAGSDYSRPRNPGEGRPMIQPMPPRIPMDRGPIMEPPPMQPGQSGQIMPVPPQQFEGRNFEPVRLDGSTRSDGPASSVLPMDRTQGESAPQSPLPSSGGGAGIMLPPPSSQEMSPPPPPIPAGASLYQEFSNFLGRLKFR